jgi:hypothetical protein
MLSSLGAFLNVLVVPFREAGTYVAMNAAAAAENLGTQDDSLMYTWFIAMGGPFIDKAGNLLVATGDFTLAVSNFLIQLAGLL